MFNAKTVENFIPESKCQEIIQAANTFPEWNRSPNTFWDDKVLNDFTVYSECDKELGLYIIQLRDRVAAEIKALYGLDKDVYSDVQQIVRWYQDMEMPPHSDDMEDTVYHDDNKHRAFGCVLYLNDDFEGGATYYPNHDVAIKPKTGMLAIHPSDKIHLHGVSKVEGGTRYTIASFWTFDLDKKQQLPI